ncbi:MAG: hypothetical protein GAK28_01006 [Luteibacter sp.]|nr:MAG: hypothetical protein GAK28_01006 [Luteibacter sp.]
MAPAPNGLLARWKKNAIEFVNLKAPMTNIPAFVSAAFQELSFYKKASS